MSEISIARSAIPLAAPTRSWRLVLGPILTVLVGVTIEALSLGSIRVPNPGVLYLAAIVASIYTGGLGVGIVSAVCALVLALVFFSVPGAIFHYSGEDLENLVTLVVAAPLIMTMVGVLKRRDELRIREQARIGALEQYRRLVEDFDAVAWERDPETLGVRFVSRAGETLLGERLDRWIEEPGFWASRIHPDDRGRTLARFREVVDRGLDCSLEYRMVGGDGQTVWVRDALRVVPDERGRPCVRGVLLDITDRKRAEEALRESETRKSAILETALDGIIDLDERGAITEFNPAAQKMFGWGRDEILGRGLADLVLVPSLSGDARAGTCRHIESIGAILGARTELIALRADGTQFPVEVAMVRTDVEGPPTFTGFLRDITRRRQAEEGLRGSEANYRLLMEKASDGIVITDLEGRFLDVNPKACEMMGYSREELIGHSVIEFIPSHELEREPLHFEALREGRQTLIERRLRRKDGELITVEINAQRLDETRLQGIYRDITERKRVEEELRQALSLLSATLDSTTDGFLVVDLQGRIISFNRRFVEMWGIPEDIVASRDDNRSIAFVLDQLRDPQEFLETIRERYARPETESFDVLEFKDGRVFERYSRPQRIGDRSVGRVWSFRDVTERRRAEAALRQSEEQLRQAQKMEAIGRLAGGVAHDFNNLLTAILGNCSLVIDALPEGDPERLGVEEIQKAAERAAALTRQLLALSRKQMLELRILDLNAVVEEMHKMLERLIGEHIELILVPGPALGRVKVDAGQIEQVILNLVVNARDAMPSGGKLIVETANVEVDAAFAERYPPLQPGPHVMLAVSDTGVGMDRDVQAHLFEPFFTTKERGRGTGLGLSTVYGIVRQSEGYVWVYSQPGRGSTFKIYLPRVEARREERAVATPAVAGSMNGSETVLLVEDEAVVRTLVRTTLANRGYHVLEAENGNRAMRVSETHEGPIELLVTDVIMPGMNGRELAERLATRREGMRVLYISGYTDETIGQPAVLARGAGFLQKPFTLEALARKVREVLDTR